MLGLLEHLEDSELLKDIPEHIKDLPLFGFDPGVFDNELRSLDLGPLSLNLGAANPLDDFTEPKGRVVQGTYGGTQAAMQHMFNRVERGFTSFFDAIGIESSIPRNDSLETRRRKYQWATIADDKKISPLGYPPHLKSIPRNDPNEDGLDDAGHHFNLYDALGLAQTSLLIPKIVPEEFIDTWAYPSKVVEKTVLDEIIDLVYSEPEDGISIKALEERNEHSQKTGTDIMQGKNIGQYKDWFSDAKYGQMQFTACNPTTVTKASPEWIQEFTQAAKASGNVEAARLIEDSDASDLYVQDASYFREAIKVAPDAEMKCEQKKNSRWACAAVSLFKLYESGKLHPLAIVIDYKGSMENSVTIFNKRLAPGQNALEEEREDWPWRYAKTCAQVSDWIRHEMTVHLTNTHLVEEVIIVATQRSLPSNHPVLRILEPHWYHTLSKNAGARETLVPNIIFDLIGFSGDQAFEFIWHAFRNFDFVGGYVPNDLPSRGFPLDKLETPKLRNYVYGKNVKSFWDVLHRFVTSMLKISYKDDAAVAADPAIAQWCREIKGPGQLTSFPTIATLDGLIDAVTMCIHIAAPQHTAVNYLQNFYQAFVISKPPMLCSAPPQDLTSLNAYNERDLLNALPVDRKREWLLAAQVPMLLSFAVTEERNLVTYAQSVWRIYYKKEKDADKAIVAAAGTLYNDLRKLTIAFRDNSRAIDDGSGNAVPYNVLQPVNTAVSILL